MLRAVPWYVTSTDDAAIEPTVASWECASTALAGIDTAVLFCETMLAGAGLEAGATTLIAVVVSCLVSPSGARSDAENATDVAAAGAVYANGAVALAPVTGVPFAASETKESWVLTVPLNTTVALYVREATSVETAESAAVRSASAWS